MDDRQLLEDAARAAGHSYPWYEAHGGQMRAWNPLTDDGDALRLAAKLWLYVFHVHGKAHAGIQGRFWRTEGWFPDGDQLSATRRAIVRAAAAIGQQMREAGNE